MGAVTHHNVMQLSVIIDVIPPPDITRENSFSEPTSGSSEITDFLRPAEEIHCKLLRILSNVIVVIDVAAWMKVLMNSLQTGRKKICPLWVKRSLFF